MIQSGASLINQADFFLNNPFPIEAAAAMVFLAFSIIFC
jgi:hypothetical protein